MHCANHPSGAFPLPIHPLAYCVKIDLSPSNSFSCQMARSLSVSSQSALEKTSGEKGLLPGSTVHAVCVALPTPSSRTTSRPAASSHQQLPSASSQPVLPAKSLQRDTLMNSSSVSTEHFKASSRGAGIDVDSHRPRKLFSAH